MSLLYLNDYLYMATYDEYDYQDGHEYCSKFEQKMPACSVMRSGDIIGRNLDWYNDEHVDIIVKTRGYAGRYATLGVAHSFGNLTSKNIINGTYDKSLLKYVPFLMSDCINSKGLYCSINVVPAGDVEGGSPVGTTGTKLCQLMIPRYVCDFAKDVDEALALLSECIIFAPLNNLNQECHFLLADGTNTVVVEFVGGEMSVIEDAPILTNFHLTGWSGDIASVALGDDESDVEATGLTDHAQGLERYKILADLIDDVDSKDDMVDAMKAVRYRKAYDKTVSPFWYSEFYGETETFGDLTIYSTADEMKDIVDYAIEHKNDSTSWISNHTSIYDLENLKISVFSRENFATEYEFELEDPTPYGIIGIEDLFPDSRKI